MSASIPRFKTGDRVRVQLRNPPGHIRTPWYLRGKRGEVLRDFGAFPFPEELAYGRSGLPSQFLYMVRFAMTEVWHADPATTAFAPGDGVTADIYDAWLDPEPAA